MRGLALNQPYASLVACGRKTLETRTYRTSWRGDLVVCSTKTLDYDALTRIAQGSALQFIPRPPEGVREESGLPLGYALAIVRVVDCRRLVPEDEPRSFFYAPDRWAWQLEDIRAVEPVPVRCMPGIFPVKLARALVPTRHLRIV